MKLNMGFGDRILRVVLAFVVLGLYLSSVAEGTLGAVFIGGAAALFLTSVTGRCPAYAIFGHSTVKVAPNEQHTS